MKPHIVYIITKLELGGAQKVCLALFDTLKQHDYHATLITASEGLLVDTVRDKQNVIFLQHLIREVSPLAFVREIKCFFELVRTLRILKKKHGTIIVHTHSTKAGILGRWAALCARIPTRIHTIHGFALHQHQSWLRWMLVYVPELFSSIITTHFVCVSSVDAQMGIRIFPWFKKKYSIIRAAVDTQQFIPATAVPVPSDVFVFGSISCFKPPKNLLDLLYAFFLVVQKYPNARLEIVGDGILRPHIEKRIQELHLEHAVTLHGWQTNTVPFMQQWNAYVMSSLWEGLPCAVVEARLLKLPVISYPTGGIPDVITHEKNGLLTQKKEPTALAALMLQVIENTTLHKNLSEHPDDLSDFSYASMTAHHAYLYRTLHPNK